MEESRRMMLKYLTDVNETLERIREIEEKMASRTVKITPSYESFGGSSSVSSVSKVERYVEEKLELEEELSKCRARLTLVEYVRESGVLTDLEYELIEWLQIGGRLSDFAKKYGIYKSNVYKIRDNAIEKVIKFVGNTPKCKSLAVKY